MSANRHEVIPETPIYRFRDFIRYLNFPIAIT